MFRAFLNYVREVRQRRAAFKLTPIGKYGLDVKKLFEHAEEERKRLWENPPPCGPVIRYFQKYGYETSCGEFLFRAEDVEQVLRNALRENPHLAKGDDGAMLNWVQKRDESLTEPTDVPSTWSRFTFVANELRRSGKVEIYCRECGAMIETGQLSTRDDRNQPGWNLNRLVCPQGHSLLVTEYMHILRG